MREHIAIPLAKMIIPPTRVSRVTGNPKLPSRPRFTPGVVNGLTVRINRKRAVAIVNPGIAVDGQGRRIHLDTVQEINLKGILQRSQPSLEPQRFLLVASFLTIPDEQSQSAPEPQPIPIGIIPETALEAYPPGTFIELQRLEVAEGSLVETTAIAQQMSAGIVSGLEVLAPNGKIEVIVTSGTAVDRRGRVIVLVTNQAVDLRAYQKQRGSLVLAIARRRNKRNWQIKFIPEAEQSNNQNHRQEHIHLASLDIPNVEAKLIPLTRLIQGLEVVPQPGMLAVRVTPGKAIDSRKEAIALHSESGTIDLMPYRGKTVQLVLFTGADRRYPRGTLRVMQPGEVERVVKPIDQDMELDTYIVLANLYLTPELLSLQPDETEQPAWLRPVGRVLDGLSVNSSPQTPARITVQRGEAIDGEQRTIHLESDCHFDLSSYAGRTLIVFISHQWGQGLPNLTCVSPSLGSGWKQIGVVPEEPWTADTGTIVIGDNGTYRGNLSIAIPSDRKLQIIAANGCRPHIRGNLDVQGTSTMDNVLFNTLTVDGLLVEGLLTVLPGRLKHLQVRHCTLLSKAGGLVVQRQVVSEESDEADDSITLLALIMYCLTLIQRLLRLGMGLEHPSPKQNLAQLARLGFQEFLQLTDAIQKAVDYWWASEGSDDTEDDLDENSHEGDRCSPENDDAGDNERLEIDIKQTICGAIALADTVAHLAIADSILDAGYGKPTGSGNDGSAAITASGTAVDISTTTVFGRVAVRCLEASNSIFTAKVTALRQQVGCMRFCHVPEGSRTPTRYLCQPERALLETLNTLPEKITAFAIARHPVSVIASTPDARDSSTTINPVFTSTGGGGVFYCSTHNNGNENKKDEWEKTHNQPSNLNVTALLAYVNAAGTLILWAGTAGGGLFRCENPGELWQSVSSGLTNTKVIALTHSENFVFAGMAGGGVLRTDEQSAGTPLIINRGLTNTNITAISNHPNGRLFVGTEGGGVFRLEQDERWTPINAGLTNRNITALVFDANGQLFAGTDGGGVFCLPKEGDRWIPVGLSSDTITALAVYCRAIPQGSISSQDTTVTGTGTQFQADLRDGDIITAFAQFKCIKTIQSDTELTIDSAFRPDLPPETPFILNNPLYAATADGKLFRSMDSGQNWTSLPMKNGISKGAQITALSVDLNNEHIFVGTAIGNIWHSQDRGKTWISMNQGLTNVDEKLLIMNRLYPRFTSRHYGDPGYGQLSRDCAVEIYTGAEDGAEMGVFNSLKQPQREASLQASLDEYLRFGLEASIFYMT